MSDTLAIERVRLDSLKRYPGNPRTHDIAMIKESLRTHGQFAPLIAQRSTNFVLAGNGRHEAMMELEWDEADVVFLDVDDDHAARIVLVDNRTSDLGDYRDHELRALLSSLDTLVGTGYDEFDLDDLLARAQETAASVRDTVDNEEDTLDSWAEGYLAKSVRTVLLDYDGAEFEWVRDRLVELRDIYDASSNAEAVKALLVETFPNTPPPRPLRAVE